MTPAEAVRKAAGILGSQTALAGRLDVRAPTVSQWCSGDRPVPAARAIQIEAFTNGEVKREELCPSFPWAEMAA
ncbi:transcriptional regulator [Pseudomonas sp. 6D_7.1_Bac1]|uniref:transcriptional regulator n=1 Tax=Pseudomonas sp. 6D_7.1_Bac1 TaxID=2971615 RepID=UPI0021CA4CC8|nr:helix-turn-helix domain-containing protein [Pseudomonas sp. 6D_7.1_Bac1]MCU1752174.1 helix-turn-helix domain-containing protein [Pseudomonas sp. 6D_7.1_Bac1]